MQLAVGAKGSICAFYFKQIWIHEIDYLDIAGFLIPTEHDLA
jgi:hypothetical protein